MRRHHCAAMALLIAAAWPVRAQEGPSRVLESFDDAAAFTAAPSDGVALALRADSGVVGRALRMEFDYQGRAGYAVARRAFTLPALPPHWAITLWVRGDARPNTLELKFVDSSGLNVWWMRRPDLQVTAGWTRLRFRSSDLTYAWGPLGGGPPRGIAALEIAFTAGQGGKGWLALDELTLSQVAAPVADSVRPRMTASSSAAKQPPQAALAWDFAAAPSVARLYGDRAGWRSAGDGAQWIALDFGGTRRLSGLVLDWSPTDWPLDYDVETSDDGRRWTSVYAVRGSAGGRRFIHLPGTEASAVRLSLARSSHGKGYVLHAVHVLGDGAAPTRTAFLERVARGSLAGFWPRALTGQQSYWTIVGPPRHERDALVSEDGAVESYPGSYSVEPFLFTNGELLTWTDGVTTHALDGGWRPIPTVRRTAEGLELAVTTFATDTSGRSVVWVRYRVANRSARARQVILSAAVRPVQVNPPWQFLGIPGGAASIGRIALDGHAIVVNDSDAVVALTPPGAARLGTFDAGGVTGWLANGSPGARLPASLPAITDPARFAEGALSWPMTLRAHDSAEVWLALPKRDAGDAMPARFAMDSTDDGPAALVRVRAQWDRELGDLRIDLPGDGTVIARTLRTALAHILVNARGAAIQPGTRSYRRSWIRDGALTSAALLRMGHAADVRAFLDWYVPRVFPNGKTPCCVDARGADPVTENDADGELLYLAAEYLRVTGDSGTVVRHWPTLALVAAHLDSLRASRRSERYTSPDSLLVFGLLPPSISHEGYSAKPAYSYWDDWWGVRGLEDAALLARTARDTSAARRYDAAGREMRGDVVASVSRSMQRFNRQALPGAAELGDLDPTSSTIALEPAQALADLPRRAVEATFDSAWVTLARRRAGGATWDVFVPYEWRDVGAYIRLDQPERAHDYAEWLMQSRRPAEWNQWSEAVWRDARAPKFVGDMPHGWVASDFIRATLDMFVYERERDSTLVVGAGVPAAWARDSAGVTVRGVRTWWGTLALTERAVGSRIRVTIDGVHPPRGVELYAPYGAAARGAMVNGVPTALQNGGRAVMLRGPAVVEFLY